MTQRIRTFVLASLGQSLSRALDSHKPHRPLTSRAANAAGPAKRRSMSKYPKIVATVDAHTITRGKTRTRMRKALWQDCLG